MLKFIANLFGATPKSPEAPAPYKVETSTSKPAKAASKPAVAKSKTARKPRAPKA